MISEKNSGDLEEPMLGTFSPEKNESKIFFAIPVGFSSAISQFWLKISCFELTP